MVAAAATLFQRVDIWLPDGCGIHRPLVQDMPGVRNVWGGPLARPDGAPAQAYTAAFCAFLTQAALLRVQHVTAYKMRHPAHAATLSETELAVAAVRDAGYRGDIPKPYAGVTRYVGPLLPAPRVCFTTGSLDTPSWRLKRYKRWTRVAELLHAACPRLSLLLLGTGSDDPIALPYVQDLRGKTTIREAAWILQHSVCAAANDTGLAHVAAAVGTPVVVAFGPTTIAKNLPRHNATAIYRAELPCRPCHYSHGLGRMAAGRACHNECMDIPPEEFVAAIVRGAASA